MSEIERYNGLTTADKGALLDAKANGFKVLCETSNGGRVFYSKYPSASEANSRIISIDLALAQIAEMEREKNPLTWNERINQMTVEEKADVAVILSKRCARALKKESCPDLTCWQCFIEFFNSPYTEGETT